MNNLTESQLFMKFSIPQTNLRFKQESTIPTRLKTNATGKNMQQTRSITWGEQLAISILAPILGLVIVG